MNARLWWFATCLVLSACGGGDEGGLDGGGEHGGGSISGGVGSGYGSGPPTARITADDDFAVGRRASFNLLTSSGTINSAKWELSNVPIGGQAIPQADGGVERVYFIPEVSGEYTIRLTLEGSEGSDTDELTFTVNERAVEAVIEQEPATYLTGESFELSAANSLGPESADFTYLWEVLNAPDGAAPELNSSHDATVAITAHVPGNYTVQVAVSAGDETSTATASFRVEINEAPFVAIRQLPAFLDDDRVSFVISEVGDPDYLPVTLDWEIVDKPPGSSPLLNIGEQSAELVVDVAGEYAVRLTVSDGAVETERVFDVVPTSVFLNLGDSIGDAEYDPVNDRIVLVSQTSNEVILIDAETADVERIALGATPVVVSVSPDGNEAVIGHEGSVSIVDLAGGAVSHVHDVPVFVNDVVHGGNGYVYVLPRAYSWDYIRSIAIDSGNQFRSTGRSIHSRTFARKQPGHDALYGTYTHTSPVDIERYDISADVAEVERDSPYHGDYPICSDLWFTEDGSLIITACGHVFSTSDVEDFDMIHVDRLDENLNARQYYSPVIVSADHSAASQLIATLEKAPVGGHPEDQFNFTARIFDDVTLKLVKEVGMPVFRDVSGVRILKPRFVFIQRTTGRVLVMADVEGAGAIKSVILHY